MTFTDPYFNPSRRQLFWFSALWLPLFGAASGAVFLWRFQSPEAAFYIWSAAGGLSLLGLFVQAAARTLFIALLIITYPISWIMSYLLLAVVFYGMVTPMGIAMRALGRDPMNRKFDKREESYWVPHQTPKTKDRYFHQY